MRGLNCRGLRLEVVAVLGMSLAWPVMAQTSLQSTATSLSSQTRIQNGHTVATFAIAVKGEDGLPAKGAAVIEEDGKQLAGAALSAEGQARLELTLPPGNHSLKALYTGDATHQGSVSSVSGVRSQAAAATPDFQVSVNPASVSLTAGQSGAATVSLTPVNADALKAPMFVTLACSGFPDQSSCAFTPENVEILPNATAPVTSSMVLTTQARSIKGNGKLELHQSHPVAWAVLLPGTLGLAGLAFGARRRKWLSRLALLGLVALVSVLGTTACGPQYYYYNHGPPYNLPTPAGSYTLQITAQSSNGITATTHTTQFALTVK